MVTFKFSSNFGKMLTWEKAPRKKNMLTWGKCSHKEQTGYDFLLLKEDKSWLLDALILQKKKDVREKVGKAVMKFIAVAMKIRRQDISGAR